MPSRRAVRRRLLAAVLGSALVLSSCGSENQGSTVDPDQVDAVEAPEIGACRVLAPEDVAVPSNASVIVPCTDDHTAETYAVGELPADLDGLDREDPEVEAWIYGECSSAFEKFLGADESMAMRTVVSWASFRPSGNAWDDGARWYRCDVVGGSEQSSELLDLPTTARGLLKGKPDDEWQVCVKGTSVQEGAKIPCTEPHDWRAVTTIKLGEADDPYPGDRSSQIRTRDFCSESVGAWLGYPVTYDYGYTWFQEPEWLGGNRRSVCWAKTTA